MLPGRAGSGGVMGSKNLKAIAVRDRDGKRARPKDLMENHPSHPEALLPQVPCEATPTSGREEFKYNIWGGG